MGLDVMMLQGDIQQVAKGGAQQGHGRESASGSATTRCRRRGPRWAAGRC